MRSANDLRPGEYDAVVDLSGRGATIATEAQTPHRSQLRRLFVVVVGMHGVFLLLWLLLQLGADQLDERDWYHLRLAGERLVDGELDDIYGGPTDGYLWRYPPPTLLLVAPLAALSPTVTYWLFVIGAFLGLAVALWALRRALEPAHMDLVVITVVGSAAFASTVVTGQASALLLGTIAVALLLATEGRHRAAAITLGLLTFKPNWLPGFGLLALSRREWRSALATLATALVIAAASLPLGVELWDSFFDQSLRNDEVASEFPGYKQSTLYSVIDRWLDGGGLLVAWLIVAGLLAGVLWVVARSPLVDLPRRFGVAVLFTLIANPYVAFYDNLVLAVPAVVWWARRSDHGGDGRWRAIGWLVAGIWLWDHAVFYYAPIFDIAAPTFSLVPLLVTAWLLIEAWDALRPRPTDLSSGIQQHVASPR